MPSGSKSLLTSLALATRMVQTSGFASARQDDDALLTSPITPESDEPRGRSRGQLAPGAEGSFYIILRLSPSEAILDYEWPLPQLVRVPSQP